MIHDGWGNTRTLLSNTHNLLKPPDQYLFAGFNGVFTIGTIDLILIRPGGVNLPSTKLLNIRLPSICAYVMDSIKK